MNQNGLYLHIYIPDTSKTNNHHYYLKLWLRISNSRAAKGHVSNNKSLEKLNLDNAIN